LCSRGCTGERRTYDVQASPCYSKVGRPHVARPPRPWGTSPTPPPAPRCRGCFDRPTITTEIAGASPTLAPAQRYGYCPQEDRGLLLGIREHPGTVLHLLG
jgi:hypothetical protein